MIENRACIVSDGPLPDRQSWEEPRFTTEELNREARDIGYKVIDIERVRDIIRAFVKEREWNALALQGPPCEGCGFTSPHSRACPIVRNSLDKPTDPQQDTDHHA